LVGEFAEVGLGIRHMIVNHVITKPDSEFLQRRQAMQRPYLDLLDQEYGGSIKITRIPLFADEIKGTQRLEHLGKLLFDGARPEVT
jgi:anion-transporting  ArsA/GET3 family ATPase